MKTNSKLREAVVEIIDYLEPIRKWTMPTEENGTELTTLFAAVDTVYQIANAALAEPPRNCDVGTAEEQAKRMDKFCDSHGHGFDGHGIYACENCRFISVDRCELAWAQMPYEAKKGGDK